MVQWKALSEQPLIRLLIYHTVMTMHFFRRFLNKDTIFREEEFSGMSRKMCILLDIAVNQILILSGCKFHC